MDFDTNVEFLRTALWQILLAAGPLLAVALTIGLLIGIIQAATSINEMTLSFVPKLVIVIFSFGLFSTYMLTLLSEYFVFIFDQITQIS
ncbi:MAG: flagellar biosynthetic protein FliQ [Rhodospirillaceae bacterium]|nr:flagellar biosynthetic protein FliQ [Rhodospirillaceae bacterium]|tara:strand:+ start:991 stop:1257 length:267 start_codon:yes stop_codon:yes gene_type:complete